MNATRRLQLVKRKGKKTTEVDIGAMEAVETKLWEDGTAQSTSKYRLSFTNVMVGRNKEAADAQVP